MHEWHYQAGLSHILLSSQQHSTIPYFLTIQVHLSIFITQQMDIFVNSFSIHDKVILYDSLNLGPSKELMSQQVFLYSPDLDVSHETFHSQIRYPQQG